LNTPNLHPDFAGELQQKTISMGQKWCACVSQNSGITQPKGIPIQKLCHQSILQNKIGYVTGGAFTDSGNYMCFVMQQNPSKLPWADKGKMVVQTQFYL
jgi:hypothetical protein